MYYVNIYMYICIHTDVCRSAYLSIYVKSMDNAIDKLFLH